MSLSPRCPSIKGGVRGPGRCAPACRSPEDVSLCGSYKEIRERGEFELSQSGYLRDWAPPPPQHFWVLGKAREAFPSYTCFQSGASEKVARVFYKLPDKNCKDLYCIKICGFHTYCCGHHKIFTLTRTSWEEDQERNLNPSADCSSHSDESLPRWDLFHSGCSRAWGHLCHSLLNKNGDSPAKKQYSLSNKEGQESVVFLLKYRVNGNFRMVSIALSEGSWSKCPWGVIIIYSLLVVV